MQQTSGFKLKLIEGTDPVDWAVLNENFKTLEERSVEDKAELARELAALAANLGAGGTNARIVWGSYQGTNTFGASAPTALSFEFKPMVVYILGVSSIESGQPQGFFLRPAATSSGTLAVTWTDRGLSWYVTSTAYGDGNSVQLNRASFTYYYVAIGVAE